MNQPDPRLVAAITATRKAHLLGDWQCACGAEFKTINEHSEHVDEQIAAELGIERWRNNVPPSPMYRVACLESVPVGETP